MFYQRRYLVLSGAVMLAAATAFGSEQNGGIPEYSTAANANTTIAAFSAGITGNAGSGSGALYDVTQGQVNGVNSVYLCVASAAHVLTGQNTNNMTLSLHMGNTLFTLNNTNSIINTALRGNKEDLGEMGVQVLQNQVTANQWAFLTALSAVNGLIAANNPAMGDALTNFGFGLSGKYLYRDTDAMGNSVTATADTFTPGLQANGHTYTALGFEWFAGDGAAYGYGTDRSTNTVADGTVAYNNGPYAYNAVQWTFSAANGTGQINSGDSGGAIYSDGEIIGINTVAQGTVVQTDGKGNAIQEDFTYGQKGYGLAFTNADITWLNSCPTMALVPEPTPIALFAIGGIAVLLRRRAR